MIHPRGRLGALARQRLLLALESFLAGHRLEVGTDVDDGPCPLGDELAGSLAIQFGFARVIVVLL